MDIDIKVKRYKKADKRKEKYDRTGGLTAKYIRINEYKKTKSATKKSRK
jgi:hypothetical protein